MNKFRTAILMLTALISVVPFSAGCSDENSSSSTNVSFVENSQNDNIGKNKQEDDLGASVTVDTTTFTVHNVIDVNKTTEDGEKYIYVKYTISETTGCAGYNTYEVYGYTRHDNCYISSIHVLFSCQFFLC